MLFLFRGHNGPLVRAIVGAVLLAIGIAVRGGALLGGIGVVLIIWGGFGVVSSLRVRRHMVVDDAGRQA